KSALVRRLLVEGNLYRGLSGRGRALRRLRREVLRETGPDFLAFLVVDDWGF
ncbi:hypothetical protein ACLOJK_038256, partial [Asimina triloba]